MSVERPPLPSVPTQFTGSVPRFALFLRPFSVTCRLAVTNPYKSGGYLWPGAAAEPNEVDLETLLSDAFGPDAPLVGLGEPGEAIGAGRVKAFETDWQEAVKKLASAAETILVIPSANDGTKWEIEYLKEQGLLAKCIFIMPPSPSLEVAESWQRSIGKVPIFVPPYERTGMVFSVDALGQVVASSDLKVKTTRALVSRIASVSQVPARQILSYNLTDQPVIRAAGFMGMYVVIVPVLGILFLVLLLLFRGGC
jgi:hypothetical protein